MKNKRESERLSKMFSGIEVLAVNPALESLEIQPESEIPSVQIAEPEEASSEYEIGAFSLAADLSANPQQIEHQSTDVPIMVDNDSIEASSLNDRMEPIVESALPLPDLSNAIPPALTSQTNTTGATPNAHPRQGPPGADKANQADWLDVGIGALTGIIVTGLILAGTSKMDIFNTAGRFILLGWEVLSGILGASVSKSSKRSRREAWLGAIQWSLVPVWIALFIGLMIYFLTFTNFFGK
jgi:hypothetical protein